jgi:hypothetical protein
MLDMIKVLTYMGYSIRIADSDDGIRKFFWTKV